MNQPGIGHNSAANARLTSFVQRIEKLEEEKKTIAEDIREVYSELKSVGFDAKIVRKVVKLRKMDKEDREAEAALLDTYLKAVGC